MKIPSHSDWEGAEQGLDEKCAYDHFFGKSLSEAEILFAEDPLFYEEDLMWMPTIPFQFYLPAFMRYLRSEASKGDPDGASSFISLISLKLGTQSKDLTELWPDIESTLEIIADRQDWYEASEDIYGSFDSRVRKVYRKARKPGKAVELSPAAVGRVQSK